MARVNVSEDEKGKPSPQEPTLKEATQPKRRTLQDRRPALKELGQPEERKIVSKPVYDTKDGVVTKKISETKEAVPRSQGAPRQEVSTLTPTPTPIRPVTSEVAAARRQQESAIEEARAAHAAQEREQIHVTRASEEKRREREEAGYRVSLDDQGRYSRAL